MTQAEFRTLAEKLGYKVLTEERGVLYLASVRLADARRFVACRLGRPFAPAAISHPRSQTGRRT